MFKLKRAIAAFILLSVCTATNNCADSITTEELNTMLLQQYNHGENRYFYPEMSCCERYTIYPQLCWHEPYCCVCTPDEGYRLIKRYTNAKKLTCQGKEITEKNFGPRYIQMIETVQTQQHDDLLHYYAIRKASNPEQSCNKFMSTCSFCLVFFACGAAKAPSHWEAERLRSLLPQDVDEEGIRNFAKRDSATRLGAVLSAYACLHYICFNTANL